MSDRGDRTGERLGPYHLDRRYEDLDQPGGQLYAAHHVETGRPALVLVPEPGERWAPRSDWSARVTAQSDPPFIVTQLDRPPPPEADALTDVDLAFIRMAGGIASVEDREDAHADFTRPPPPGWNREAGFSHGRHVKTGALVAGVLVLGAVALWSRLPGPSRQEVDTFETAHAGPSAWIDQTAAASVRGYPMPKAAYPEQAKPPCPSGYEDIRGGCWGQLKKDAPCVDEAAEYEGKCYLPLREKKPVPRSLGH